MRWCDTRFGHGYNRRGFDKRHDPYYSDFTADILYTLPEEIGISGEYSHI